MDGTPRLASGGLTEQVNTIRLPPLTSNYVQHQQEPGPQDLPVVTTMPYTVGPAPKFEPGAMTPKPLATNELITSYKRGSDEDYNSVTFPRGSYRLPKFSRTTWKPHEDISLLRILLNRKHQLTNPQYFSSPRSKFWQWISDQLYREYRISRNTRQCRDRFNLLYKKTSKRFATQLHPPPQGELEQLLKMLLESFDFNPEGNIILREAQILPIQTSVTPTSALSSQGQSTQEQMSDRTPSKEQELSEQTPKSMDNPADSSEGQLLILIHNLRMEVAALRNDVKQLKELLTQNTSDFTRSASSQ